jgi:uncharacterized protein (TIGR02246 family)
VIQRVNPLALVSSVTLLLLCSPAVGTGTQKNDDAAIEAVTERWALAYAKGDLEAISQMYTEDAKLLPEGSGAVVGRAAILKYFEKNLRPTLPATLSFSHYEIYGNGQVATSVSELEIRDPDGRLKTRGKQIIVLLNQGGQWKIHRDIWTNNGPIKPGDR